MLLKGVRAIIIGVVCLTIVFFVLHFAIVTDAEDDVPTVRRAAPDSAEARVGGLYKFLDVRWWSRPILPKTREDGQNMKLVFSSVNEGKRVLWARRLPGDVGDDALLEIYIQGISSQNAQLRVGFLLYHEYGGVTHESTMIENPFEYTTEFATTGWKNEPWKKETLLLARGEGTISFTEESLSVAGHPQYLHLRFE